LTSCSNPRSISFKSNSNHDTNMTTLKNNTKNTAKEAIYQSRLERLEGEFYDLRI